MIRRLDATRRTVLKGAGALAAASALPAFAAEMSAREKELYEAAKKEGELTWYTAHSDDVTAQALGREFEKIYPGIKVNVVRTTAQVAFQRVTQEVRAGAMQVDVLSSTDLGHYVSLKEKNLLERYVPENAAKAIDVYKNSDPDGLFYVTRRGSSASATTRRSSRRPRSPRPGPSSSTLSGRIRSRPATPASAATSAPGW
jgi:iron(III) transport system substrate-binding protein